jgi:DNA repair protein RecO (recombination protein O)
LTVHAVVLRRRDAGESDRRLTLLTPESGKIDAVAKGARKPGSRLGGASEPLSVSIFQLATGRKNLFVTQVQPVTSFPGLRGDYDKLSIALAFLELCAAVLPYEEPSPEAFDLCLASLSAIEAHEKPVVALVWAELRLMDLAGFMPRWDECVVTGQPVAEALPFVSPHAGGYVLAREAGRFVDRLQTKAEILYGLARAAELDEPPPALKLASESARLLLPFWRNIVDAPLPANEALMKQLIVQAEA